LEYSIIWFICFTESFSSCVSRGRGRGTGWGQGAAVPVLMCVQGKEK